MKKILILVLLVLSSFIFFACTTAGQTKIYLVTFNYNNGTPLQRSYVKEGDYVVRPADPRKNGYEFLGWSTQSENLYLFHFDTVIHQDYDLYALYQEIGDVVKAPYLDIYYMNDLHGMLLKEGNSLGISNIANFVKTQKTLNPETTLFLTGGDMLQGSALSNHFYGRSTIDLLNDMQMDAYVVGNHEFDWGIDKVLNYFDGDQSNGEAIVPILGANVFYKGTTNLVTGFSPYTIVNKGGYKIGIIGTIGYGLESSIAYSRISSYQFGNPVDSVRQWAAYLRVEEACDLIISISHSGGDTNVGFSYASENQQIAYLQGDEKVDILFNAHTHQAYSNQINQKPVLQAASYAYMLGYVGLDFEEGNLSNFHTDLINDNALFATVDSANFAILNNYKNLIDPLYSTPIIYTPNYLSRNELSEWLAKLMTRYTNATVGLQNYGGTRIDIEGQTSINMYDLYKVIPFDNAVKSTYLSGAAIKSYINNNPYYCAIYVNGFSSINSLNDSTSYLVVTNDYVFDYPANPFNSGSNPYTYELSLRDLFAYELNLQAATYSNFYLSNNILTTPAIIQPGKHQLYEYI
ncbi:MAG: InlB B-repeat-containing protein [Acholeplasmatales bacterium]|jgi:2',3'-cyclic-nucleotide 2'-phosphodiesterase (5'-nucleotidase family)|nr:InlB B-repeat-containing protein [Acholeplasmatales bacterium]